MTQRLTLPNFQINQGNNSPTLNFSLSHKSPNNVSSSYFILLTYLCYTYLTTGKSFLSSSRDKIGAEKFTTQQRKSLRRSKFCNSAMI